MEWLSSTTSRPSLLLSSPSPNRELLRRISLSADAWNREMHILNVVTSQLIQFYSHHFWLLTFVNSFCRLTIVIVMWLDPNKHAYGCEYFQNIQQHSMHVAFYKCDRGPFFFLTCNNVLCSAFCLCHVHWAVPNLPHSVGWEQLIGSPRSGSSPLHPKCSGPGRSSLPRLPTSSSSVDHVHAQGHRWPAEIIEHFLLNIMSF